MNEEELDGEINGCDQCGWDLVGTMWTAIYGVCDECSQLHVVALVHTYRCLSEHLIGEDKARSQMRRAGEARLN